jgi:hypothetical protein
MKRVGVAKLPLSAPALKAKVAAPADAINKVASGMNLADRGERFVYPGACSRVNAALTEISLREKSANKGLFVEQS